MDNTEIDVEKFCAIIATTKLLKNNTPNIGLFDNVVCSNDQTPDVPTEETFVIAISVAPNGYTASYTLTDHTETFAIKQPNISSLLSNETYVQDLAFYLLNTMPYQGYAELDGSSNSQYLQHNKQRFKLLQTRIQWLEDRKLFYVITDPRITGGIPVKLVSVKRSSDILKYYRNKLGNGRRYDDYQSWLDYRLKQSPRYTLGMNYYASIVAGDSILNKVYFLESEFSFLFYDSIVAGVKTRLWPRVTTDQDRIKISYYDLSLGHSISFDDLTLTYGIFYGHQTNDIRLATPATDEEKIDFKDLSEAAPGFQLSVSYNAEPLIFTVGYEQLLLAEIIQSKVAIANIDVLVSSTQSYTMTLNGSFYWEQKELKEVSTETTTIFDFKHTYTGLGFRLLF